MINMVPEYIIEICVAIDIAILGIAYPIIIDKISNIGDKYSSQYISELFDNEFPQKSLSSILGMQHKGISLFKFILYCTLASLLFLIFKTPPLFGWNNAFINNSAKYIVLFCSFTFTTLFLIWLDKVSLYNGRSAALLKYIISKYNALPVASNIKEYYLKSINELTFYSIEKQDEHLQQTLLDFYHSVFINIRKRHNKTKPLIYPIDLYFLINKLNIQVVDNDNKKLKALEHRAVSGVWLFGEDFENIIISEETYVWVWRNIYNICDYPRLVKMFWGNSSQYFSYQLQQVLPEYSFDKDGVVNQEEVNIRIQEREKFLELHYAIGGLMLYRKQYETIKYFFEYTQSQPPKYVLLPDTMTEVFKWFEYFNNEFRYRGMPIDIKYSFPELDSIGTRKSINHYICLYIALLFIRQYTLQQYYSFQSFTSLPDLPDGVLELNSWLENVAYFERCLDAIIENDVLMSQLEYADLVAAKAAEFKTFIEAVKDSIENIIGQQKMGAELSEDKLASFYSSTGRIINAAFANYDSVFVKKGEEHSRNQLSYTVNGGVVLMSKSSFTDDDIPTLNFDTFFAGVVASQNIKRMIPNSFAVSSTKRYLLNEDNILLGLDKLIDEKSNVVIVGVEIGYQLKQILDNSLFKNKLKYIPSTDYDYNNVLFVLNESDLPAIEYEEISPEEMQNLKLVLVNEQLKVYASVLDISKPENKVIKDRWSVNDKSDSLDLKVQLAIVFSSTIFWKEDREIIQINIASEYKEQGIQNDISDVSPLRDVK